MILLSSLSQMVLVRMLSMPEANKTIKYNIEIADLSSDCHMSQGDLILSKGHLVDAKSP